MSTLPPQDDTEPKCESVSRVPLTCGELFDVHAKLKSAEECLRDTTDNLQSLLSSEKAELTYLTDWEQRFEEQVSQLRARSDRLGVALDRIKIVALNTGLEGARLGDLAGKVLVGVSDELRQLTGRSLELLLEQTAALEQIENERERLRASAVRHHNHVGQLAQLQEGFKGFQQVEKQALGRLSNALEAATGLDPEAQAGVARATEQARQLVASLAHFSKPEHRTVARAAVAVQLQPLLEFLAQDETVRP